MGLVLLLCRSLFRDPFVVSRLTSLDREASFFQECSTTGSAVDSRSQAAGILALHRTHSETFVVLVAAQVKNGEIIAADCVAGATAIGEVFVQATPHTYSKRMHFWCFKCKSRQTRDYANSCYQS
jgi:hypothetical protein